MNVVVDTALKEKLVATVIVLITRNGQECKNK